MKHFNKLGWMLLVMVLMVGAGVGGNFFQIGDSTSADKEIEFMLGLGNENPKLKAQSDGTIKFGNDNTGFQNIGSGGGGSGGLNDLSTSNADCELASGGVPTDWTASGGTFEQTATGGELINGVQSCKWDSNAAAQTLDTELVAISPRNIGAACLARVYYRYENGAAANGDYTVHVFDGTGNITDPQDVLVTTAPNKGVIDLAFVCPASGSYQVRFTSVVTDGEDLIFDDAQLGEDSRKGVTDTAKITPWVAFTPTGSWNTNVTYTGQKRQVGDTLEMRVLIVLSGAPNAAQLTIDIPDSLTMDASTYEGSEIENLGQALLSDTGTAANRTKATILPGAGAINAVRLVSIGAGNVDQATPFTWATGDQVSLVASIPIVEFAGQGSQETVTLETKRWFIDVSIGGAQASARITDSNKAVFQDSDWDLVVNTGSASAEITCASAEAPGGLTCTADETTGFAFVPPFTGDFLVCVSGINVITGDSAADTIRNYWSLNETGLTDETAISMGAAKTSTSLVGAAQQHFPVYLCDILHVSSASKKAIKLMSSVSAASTPTGNTLFMDRASGFDGDRDLNFKVFPLKQNFLNAVALIGDEISIDASSIGDFDAGQTDNFELKKDHNGVVTMQFNNLAHSLTATPSTGVGVMPARFRPLHSVFNVYITSSSQVLRVETRPDGDIRFSYVDWSGSGSVRTSTSQGSITWTTD